MNKIKKIIALTTAITLLASQIQSQEMTGYDEAYSESSDASYLSAALPIGALAVAAIIIATTHHHHHHTSSSSTSTGTSSHN